MGALSLENMMDLYKCVYTACIVGLVGLGCEGEAALVGEVPTDAHDQGSVAVPADMRPAGAADMGTTVVVPDDPDMASVADSTVPADDMAGGADEGVAEMPVDMAPAGPWQDIAPRWQSIDLGERSDAFVVTFSMEAVDAQVNAVLGIGPGIAGAYDDLASIVRLAPEGIVDVRSGDDYVALNPALSYRPGEPLAVRMAIDPGQTSYEVSVSESSGSRSTRDMLAFRSSQSQASTLRYLSVYASEGQARVRDVRVNGELVDWQPVMPPVSPSLLDANIDAMALRGFGSVTRADLEGGFGPIISTSSIQHLAVVEEAGRGRVLRARYEPKGNGSDRVQFRVRVDAGDERWLSYRLYFEPGFEWVKGGKLPGLAGGSANTGGNKPDGTDGYTSRYMWRRDGRLVVYLYHPDQPSTFGEDFGHDGLTLETGRWYTVRQRIVMNTGNQANGVLETWVDDRPFLSESIRYRSRDNAFEVDALYFSTFYGGNDPSWAPSRTTYIRFDDFKVAAARGGVD